MSRKQDFISGDHRDGICIIEGPIPIGAQVILTRPFKSGDLLRAISQLMQSGRA